METKNIIIICLTIIVLVCLGIFLMTNMNSQEESHITILTSQYLTAGDSLKLKLCDKDSKGIANQTIDLKIKSNDGSKNDEITVATNEKGECRIDNIPKGNYTLTAKYAGTRDYQAYTLNYEFVVKEKEVQKPRKNEGRPCRGKGSRQNQRNLHSAEADAAGVSQRGAKWHNIKL